MNTKEDILEYIQKAALSYTPQWRFDTKNPDGGTALAMAYADMFSKTIGQFNKVFQKHQIAFFNSIGAGMLSPTPSGGYAVFNMVNDSVMGTEIEKGITVYADTSDGEVAFETVDDVYATPAILQEIYQVSDRFDSIKHIYSAKADEEKKFLLFTLDGTNLSKHTMYFSHDEMFHIKKEATLELILHVRGDVSISGDYINLLLDRENAVFEYYSTNGYEPLSAALSNSQTLIFHKSEYQPPFEKTTVEGVESYWIRCRILNIAPFINFSFESFYMTSKAVYMIPDMINGNGIECNIQEYMPFGERFGLYNEVYFASKEALSKIGSRIDFTFTMDFARVPLSEDNEDEDMLWNWVMKKSDFKVDMEFDLTIEEVLWEYFNGSGWSRLFNDGCYSDIFTTENGLKYQYRTLSFICPMDMAPILVNSCESYYIRARIIKINNLYKTKGFYVVPILSDTSFSYDYAGNIRRPKNIFLYNNLENEAVLPNQSVRPFKQIGVQQLCVYLGFTRALDLGPVKLLFSLEENRIERYPQLRWEYYGSRGFTELNFVDDTDNFSRTGIVTVMGNSDFKRCSIFGESLYWLRIIDENDYYTASVTAPICPNINGIYMNAVKISNVDIKETEYFAVERFEENKTIQLLHKQLIASEVWIDEADWLTQRQLDELGKQYEIAYVYDAIGNIKNAWIKWIEAEDFLYCDAGSRCYCANENEGIITFGNGHHGKIIPASRKDVIRVNYKCGGGQRSNLDAGAINRIEHSIGFVNAVSNPFKLFGGFNQETLLEALDRNAQILTHRYKAVTPEDFEKLILCASRNICRAKCFTGYNGNGDLSPGAMTLVVLQKDFQSGHYVFNDTKEIILKHMADKMNSRLLYHHQFFIVEPEFAQVGVRLELTATDLNLVFQIKKEIEKRLEHFLNPIDGHFDGSGWEIGSFPTGIQIQNLLRDIKGIQYIKNIYLTAYTMGNSGKKEADISKLIRRPFILPANGEHDIIIKL